MMNAIATGFKTISQQPLAMLLAGCLALAAFDFFGKGIAPLIMGGPLSPVGLVRSVANNLIGGVERNVAEMAHILAGIIAYPIGYALIRGFVPLPEMLKGAVYGVLLWIFALGIMAPIGGLPLMLGFGTITWVSLLAHVVFGLALGAVFPKDHSEAR